MLLYENGKYGLSLTGSVKDPGKAVERRAREDARFSSGREGAPRSRMLNTTMSIARDSRIPFAAAASRYQPSRRRARQQAADGWYDAVSVYAGTQPSQSQVASTE